MTTAWWTVLWTSSGLLLWVYLVYPALLWLGTLRHRPPSAPLPELPSISLILSVYNEAAVLRRKLDNCLSLDYPPERLEMIVVSDGSTDETEGVLREYAPRGIQALIPGRRIGKTAAQNLAAAQARHEILFFTDATTTHPPEVLRELVAPFADPGVGCASGQAMFRDDRSLTSTGQQAKVFYDRFIRRSLTRVRTLFGAAGCVYAVRRGLYVPLRPDLVSDFVEPLKLLEAGYRTAYVPTAIGFVDRPAPAPRREFARRARMVLRGFRGMVHMRSLLDPRRGVLQALSLASQRPLKWLTPLYLIGLLLASIALHDHPAVGLLLLLQVAFYGIAVAGWILELMRIRPPRLLGLPLYFCIISLAALAALIRLLRGDQGMLWEPIGRDAA